MIKFVVERSITAHAKRGAVVKLWLEKVLIKSRCLDKPIQGVSLARAFSLRDVF